MGKNQRPGGGEEDERENKNKTASQWIIVRFLSFCLALTAILPCR